MLNILKNFSKFIQQSNLCYESHTGLQECTFSCLCSVLVFLQRFPQKLCLDSNGSKLTSIGSFIDLRIMSISIISREVESRSFEISIGFHMNIMSSMIRSDCLLGLNTFSLTFGLLLYGNNSFIFLNVLGSGGAKLSRLPNVILFFQVPFFQFCFCFL